MSMTRADITPSTSISCLKCKRLLRVRVVNAPHGIAEDAGAHRKGVNIIEYSLTAALTGGFIIS